MPEAPAATSVLSAASTSVPFWAACQAVDRPWTPAPMTRRGVEEGRDSGMLLPPGQCYWRIGTADRNSSERGRQGASLGAPRARPAWGWRGPVETGKLHTRCTPGEEMCG